jgi:hypothetical protein
MGKMDWYDYGKRFYDPVIGRFTGVDPIAEDFYYVTPFNYAENSPIANIDLWGLQAVHFQKGLDKNKEFNLGYDAQRNTKVGTIFSEKLASQKKYDVFYFSLEGRSDGTKVTLESLADFLKFHETSDIRRSINLNELKDIMKSDKSLIIIGVNKIDHDGVGNEDPNNTGKTLNHEEFHAIDDLNGDKYTEDEEHEIYTGNEASGGFTPNNKEGSLGDREEETIDKYVEDKKQENKKN